MNGSLLSDIRRRLANREDSEHGQALVRIAIVSIVVIYFFTSFFATYVVDPVRLQQARFISLLSLSLSFAIFAAIVMRPEASVIRRLIGMVHDVAAISASIYLGQSAGAAIAVIYLWITLGNGFRYGVAYLFGCGALSIAGFLIVWVSSEYWQTNVTLSVNIMLTMLVVPPYAASLLKSLHSAKDELHRRASTDGLTGLLTRREMEKATNTIFRGDHSNHALLYCDLDRFKEVNDVAGHAAGDKLLVDVAEIVRSSVRNDDLCGRVGGDEFCILLYNCSLERAREIAEEIRSRTTGYRLAWGTDYYSVGVSIGVAPTGAVNDCDSLFRLADAACYAAKNAGRNKVHVVDPRTDLIDTQRIRQLFDSDAGNDIPREANVQR